MSISPESFAGFSNVSTGEHLKTIKIDRAQEIIADRIRSVADRVGLSGDDLNSHALLFCMTRDRHSVVEAAAGETWVLSKGRMQKVALEVMERFGFNSEQFRVCENTKVREIYEYPSATHEGLVFRRFVEKNKRKRPVSVTWTVHARNRVT